MATADDEAYEYYADPKNQVPTGPGRSRKSQPLTTHVPIRFSTEVIAAVKRLAEHDQRTVSSWIRLLVEQEIELRTDETDTTPEQFDAMWERGEPVETITPYDWADDPSMSAEETMRRFNALGPDLIVGPDEHQRKQQIRRVADAIWEYGFRTTGTAGSGMDISDNSLAASIVDRLNNSESHQAAS
jgi:hypothetical protein